MASEVDSDLCKDLAVSLHLNLAACAIKLGYFHRAFDVCSLVININPSNTKARLRTTKVALEMGLTAAAFEELTTVTSLALNNIEIHSELEKVVLLFKSTIKGKRKLDNFDHPVTEDRPFGDVTGIPFMCFAPSRSKSSMLLSRESSTLDAQTNKATTPISGLMTEASLEVDTKVEEVTSSSVVLEDGFNSTSLNPNLVEPMYRFANRQSHDSSIKIHQSSYQALLISVRIRQPRTISTVFTSKIKGHTIIGNSTDRNDCPSNTTTLDNYTSKVGNASDCMVQDYSSSSPDHSLVIYSDIDLSRPCGEVPLGMRNFLHLDQTMLQFCSMNFTIPSRYLCNFRKKSLHRGSLKITFRATRMGPMAGKGRYFSHRHFIPSPFSTNRSLPCRTPCGHKRKASTYNGDDGIHLFTQRRIFAPTTCSYKRRPHEEMKLAPNYR